MFIIFGQFRNTKTAKVLTIVLGIIAALPLLGALTMLLLGDLIMTEILFFMSAIFGFFFLTFLINWLTCCRRDRKKAEAQK